ncbi:hypothetical protein BRO54_1384 [Geobacillus proteiniphilus]|uniref:Uncharacterized protein n=1 Tax=Geobacillus proteiniphilus TaxID=860353 RepID=A0A1Q5T3L0_9BACL|nr:hypothetical protein BRO54_1384 [Geobacillus proteiniphilus]
MDYCQYLFLKKETLIFLASAVTFVMIKRENRRGTKHGEK